MEVTELCLPRYILCLYLNRRNYQSYTVQKLKYVNADILSFAFEK